MVLDHTIHYLNTGVYMTPSDAPHISHPVVALGGMRFACLSFSPAADGTRAADWYTLDFSGLHPVCSCRAFTYRGGSCKHIAVVAAQVDDLCRALTAQWAAERAARRGQTGTEGVVLPPPVKHGVAA